MTRKAVLGMKNELRRFPYGANDGLIDENTTCGRNLRKLREYCDVKQTELAEAANLGVKRIRSIEHDEVRPDSEELSCLMPFLGFSYKKLLMGASPQNINAVLTLGLNDKSLEWLQSADKDGGGLKALNLLFSDQDIIESVLHAMQTYVESGFAQRHCVVDGHEVGQYDFIEMIKNRAIDELRGALDLLVEDRYVFEEREAVLGELEAKSVLKDVGDDLAKRLAKLERRKKRQRDKWEQEDIAEFDREVKEEMSKRDIMKEE